MSHKHTFTSLISFYTEKVLYEKYTTYTSIHYTNICAMKIILTRLLQQATPISMF